MDAAVATLLAQRLGLTGADESAADGQPNDPMMAALLRQLVSTAESTPDDTDRLERRLASARRRLGRLRTNLTTALAMVQHIAAVFGACPRCWGLNQLCSHCQGAGGPGWQLPDTNALLQWVEPALARVGMQARVVTAPQSVVDEQVVQPEGEV
ncbi:MAG TPA: hypothetical protein VGX25_02050 [Actinophytocola sp.]|uniref:hypothetical protein n=1 Tax=Actinophytocola sp. TaxID=1872138 RepID=UPI002DDD1B6E|nr:hypothetical protein [Actinophytocola sp.]HEV2778161.1 hypothetical protein [Actinophytocola sp.]